MVADQVLTEVVTAFTATVVGDFTADDVLRQLVHGATRVLDVDGAGVMVPQPGRSAAVRVRRRPVGAAVASPERLQEQLAGRAVPRRRRQRAPINIADLASKGTGPSSRTSALAPGCRR